MQINTQNRQGDMLAYDGVDIPAGSEVEIVSVIVAEPAEFVLLNLSLPTPSDWANSHFVVEVDRGRVVWPVIDQAAQFIDTPWSIPIMLSAGDEVKLVGVNGSAAGMRFAGYLAIRGHNG